MTGPGNAEQHVDHLRSGVDCTPASAAPCPIATLRAEVHVRVGGQHRAPGTAVRRVPCSTCRPAARRLVGGSACWARVPPWQAALSRRFL